MLRTFALQLMFQARFHLGDSLCIVRQWRNTAAFSQSDRLIYQPVINGWMPLCRDAPVYHTSRFTLKHVKVLLNVPHFCSTSIELLCDSNKGGLYFIRQTTGWIIRNENSYIMKIRAWSCNAYIYTDKERWTFILAQCCCMEMYKLR
jgi:hypothetical protein